MKTNLPGYVAKIYYQPSRQKIKKLQVMVKYPPRDPTASQNHVSIAWPIDLLSTPDGHTIGYLMPEIQLGTVLNNVYIPKLRKKKAPGFDWKYLYTTAKNLASAVSSIHNKGYVIGDVNPQNILVNNQAAVSIIDTDSFQVKDPDSHQLFRCPVGSPGFTPVELLKKKADFSLIDRSETHDRFGLAAIIYLLLFCGNHPYSGKWKGHTDPPQDQNGWVEAGAWPYSKNSPVEPTANAIPMRIVHPALRHCFQRAFGEGHVRPAYRPTAAEWYTALNIAGAALKQCAKVPSHWFDSTTPNCYWCDRKSASGYDYFPPVNAYKRAPANQSCLQAPKKRSTAKAKAHSSIPLPQRVQTTPANAAIGQKKTPPGFPVHPCGGPMKNTSVQRIGQRGRSNPVGLAFLVTSGYVWGGLTLRWSGDEFVNLKQVLIQSTYLVITSLFVIIERRISSGYAVPGWLLKNHRWVQFALIAILAALFAAFSKFYYLKPTILYDLYSIVIFMLLAFAYHRFKLDTIVLALIFFCTFSNSVILIPMLIPTDINSTGLKVASSALGCIVLSFIVTFSRPRPNRKKILSKGFNAKGSKLTTGTYGAYLLDAIGPSIITIAVIWYLITAGMVPPVPLHVRYAGIFCNVEKVYSSDGNYHYSLKKRSQPWFKFWQNDIFSLPGAFDPYDKIYSFAAVFAPFCLPGSRSNKHIQLTDKWEFYNTKTRKWITKHQFNWKMKGGRWGGWRTYESIDAADMAPGLWRIQIFTSEDHLVGKYVFRIVPNIGGNREVDEYIY